MNISSETRTAVTDAGDLLSPDAKSSSAPGTDMGASALPHSTSGQFHLLFQDASGNTKAEAQTPETDRAEQTAPDHTGGSTQSALLAGYALAPFPAVGVAALPPAGSETKTAAAASGAGSAFPRGVHDLRDLLASIRVLPATAAKTQQESCKSPKQPLSANGVPGVQVANVAPSIFGSEAAAPPAQLIPGSLSLQDARTPAIDVTPIASSPGPAINDQKTPVSLHASGSPDVPLKAAAVPVPPEPAAAPAELAFAIRVKEQQDPKAESTATAPASPAPASVRIASKVGMDAWSQNSGSDSDPSGQCAPTTRGVTTGPGTSGFTPGSPAPAQAVSLPSSTALTQPPVTQESARSALSAAAPASQSQETQQGVVRDMSIRITDDQSRTASVRLVERDGEVRIAVRTADAGVSSSLRSDLTELVSRIEKIDASAEVWHPATQQAASSGSDSNTNAGRNSDSGASSQQYEQGGQGFGQSHGQHSGRGNQHAPKWLEDFDETPARGRLGK